MSFHVLGIITDFSIFYALLQSGTSGRPMTCRQHLLADTHVCLTCSIKTFSQREEYDKHVCTLPGTVHCDEETVCKDAAILYMYVCLYRQGLFNVFSANCVHTSSLLYCRSSR